MAHKRALTKGRTRPSRGQWRMHVEAWPAVDTPPRSARIHSNLLFCKGGHATKDPAGGVLGSLDDRCICGQHKCSHRMRTHCACAQAHAHTHPTCTYSVCARHACTCHIPTCDICTCHTYTCVCLMGAYEQVSMTTIPLNTRV